MRKNFLTTGAVIALAWISLAPLALLFIATIATNHTPFSTKLFTLLLTLFLWIFLSMGTGLLWQKESHKEIASPSSNSKESKSKLKRVGLEMLQEMKESNFSALCIRVFERMWPEIVVEKGPDSETKDQDLVFHRRKKTYLIHCENQKTFFDSREIQFFGEAIRKKKVSGGYFFTTGVFSTSAQEIASSGTIELIDGQKTIELVESFLNERDLLSYQERALERRRHLRITGDAFASDHKPSIEFGNIYQRTTRTQVYLVNLSAGGACIKLAQEELPIFFQLSVKLPPHPESLYILGEVVWRRAQPEEKVTHYGISFVSIPNESRRKLDRFIAETSVIK